MTFFTYSLKYWVYSSQACLTLTLTLFVLEIDAIRLNDPFRYTNSVRTGAVAQLSSIHFYPLGSLVTRDLINLADVVILWQFELIICGCQFVCGSY